MLFCRFTEDEVRELFADRASKGFTVIQAVVCRDDGSWIMVYVPIAGSWRSQRAHSPGTCCG